VLTERVEYLDENGKLVTESLRDYSRKAIRALTPASTTFSPAGAQLSARKPMIEELAEEGLLLEPLMEEIGKDLDPFDLICHIAFDQPPLTRRERANSVKKRDVFSPNTVRKPVPCSKRCSANTRTRASSVGWITFNILEIPPFNDMGTPMQLIKQFGSKANFENAVHELQAALYQEVA
jgi:type I restriction enzyme R subunit